MTLTKIMALSWNFVFDFVLRNFAVYGTAVVTVC